MLEHVVSLLGMITIIIIMIILMNPNNKLIILHRMPIILRRHGTM